MDDAGHPPDLDGLWKEVIQSRMDIAELKGMISMHFRDGQHHVPPCAPAANLQRTILAAAGASILALLSAIGSLLMEVFRHG
jgi:hypothetical protein